MIGIVNYGMGNLLSVYNALDFIGANVEICNTPKELINKDKLYGFESLEDFRHLTDLSIYKQLLKN